MMKALLLDRKAATVAEFATFVSLAFTLGLVIFIGLDDMGEGVYSERARNTALLSERITENCLVRTRANDIVTARQAEPYNCFNLAEGNDRVTVGSGDNIIYPGTGRNVVIARAGSRETQVVYEGGSDVLHFGGGRAVLDMRGYTRDQIVLSIAAKTPETIDPDAATDDPGRTPVDLVIGTPRSKVIVADHFNNKPIELIVLKDVTIGGDDITLRAISDQTSGLNDQIVGTPLNDIVSPGAGNDFVTTFEGDDVIIYTSGNDRYDPGPGQDILEIPNRTSAEARLSIAENGTDVRVVFSEQDKILLIDQARYPHFSDRAQFAAIHFSDHRLIGQEIIARAVKDQGTPGDDVIYGTAFADTIYPGKGSNIIIPGLGSDTIIHQGGIDTIVLDPLDFDGVNILSLESYERSQITFARGVGYDLVLTSPSGSMVTIKDQFMTPLGEKGSRVHIFKFKGEDLTDDIMRKLYFPEATSQRAPN